MYGFPRRSSGTKIIIKTPREITIMRKSAEISALALKHAGEMVKPGVTTWEINRAIGEFIKNRGAKASFRGLYGFPGNACISINDELIHGIPARKRTLCKGDIVSIDVGANKDGYHGDNAMTFYCGGEEACSKEAIKLVRTCEQSLQNAIVQCVSGNRVGDISNAIQQTLEGAGYFIPEDYFGHGVGRDLHEDPNVSNFGKPGRGPRLTPGMTIAIEPMVCESTKKTKVMRDKWTVVEGNGNLTAHFEHTILITKDEPLVMTKLV
ncbi:MAG: type I methionyl aminopeptidase [Oscillospiraceae bacterium]|nr:type I methionyl aminopeptidase [Oscillospiraceae bacterium]